MPMRENQCDLAPRLQSGQNIVVERLPCLLANDLGFSFFAARYGVVDDDAVVDEDSVGEEALGFFDLDIVDEVILAYSLSHGHSIRGGFSRSAP